MAHERTLPPADATTLADLEFDVVRALLERHAPDCRLLLPGGGTSRADWAEFRRFAALVGPPDQLRAAAPALRQGITGLGGTMGVCQILPDIADRTALVAAALAAWLPAVRSSPTTHQEASS